MQHRIFSHAATAALLTLLVAGAIAPQVSAQTEESCDIDIDVSLVIDRSGSMSINNRLATAQSGAAYLLGTLGATDRSGLVSYDHAHTLDVSVTNTNHATTDAAVQALAPGGGTSAEPAIRESRLDLTANPRAGVTQIMIHLTDGHSGGNPAAEAALAKAAGIEVYVIGIGGGVNEADLQAQASTPTSKYYHNPHTSAELIAVFEQLAHSINGHSAHADSYAEWNLLQSTTAGVVANSNKVNHQVYPPGEREVFVEETVTGHGLQVVARAFDNEADGRLLPNLASSQAGSSITGLEVLYNGAPILRAESLVAEATASASPGWNGYDDGNSNFVGLWVLGSPVGPNVAANTVIPLGPLGQLVLNEQIVEQTAGAVRFEVNAIHLQLDVGGSGAETFDLIISHAAAAAQCGSDDGEPPCDPATNPLCAPPCEPDVTVSADPKGGTVKVDTECLPCDGKVVALTECAPCDDLPTGGLAQADPCNPCDALPQTTILRECPTCLTDCEPCDLVPAAFDCNVECTLPRIPDLTGDARTVVEKIMRALSEAECNIARNPIGV